MVLSVRRLKVLGLIVTVLLSSSPALFAQSSAHPGKKGLRVGISGIISPKETISIYQQILYYLGEQLGVPVEMVQRRTYDEMDQLLRNQEVDFAFICSGPYVKDHAEFGAEIIAAPQARGEKVYYAYIITAPDSAINNFDDLRGHSFAFTDPDSNTGFLVPVYMLALKGESPDNFFSRYQFSGNHGLSIEKVARKEVDGAAVDHLIWEYFNATDPTFTSKTKVIHKSSPYGMPPVVTHPATDPVLKKRVQDILLNMHQDPDGMRILAKIFVDRFYVPKDSEYGTIREMEKWISTQKQHQGNVLNTFPSGVPSATGKK